MFDFNKAELLEDKCGHKELLQERLLAAYNIDPTVLAQAPANDEFYGPRGPAWCLAILDQAGNDVICAELPREHQVLLETDNPPEAGSLAQVVGEVQQALRFFNTYRASEHQREQDQEQVLPAPNGQHRYQS